MSSVDIVIVNWNSGDQLRDCVASISQAASPEIVCQVVVVDNASVDDSYAGLQCPNIPLLTVRNVENLGFAAACNQGAAKGRAEYLLFLNPDARLQSRSLTCPLAFMDCPSHADTGICGIQLLGEDARIAKSCARFPTPANLVLESLGADRWMPRWLRGLRMTEWDHASTRYVDHVIGAFYLVRRTVFERMQGFDTSFFVYLEDIDFSYRASKAGWRTVYLADAQAYHRGGGTSERAKCHRLFYSLRSRILYAAKHFSVPGACLIAAATLLVEPWIRVAWATLRFAPSEIGETIAGFLLLWSDAPRLLPALWRRDSVPLPKTNERKRPSASCSP